jgi:hypothetical protein
MPAPDPLIFVPGTLILVQTPLISLSAPQKPHTTTVNLRLRPETRGKCGGKMKTVSASRSTRAKAFGVAALIAAGLGVAVPLTDAAPAQAACKPASSMWSMYVTTPYRIDNLWVNACAARKLHDTAGDQSAALILPSLVAGWVPGGKMLGTALGSYSGLLWLTQNKLKTCTAKFTRSATIAFSKGVPVSCKAGTRARRGGGTF